MARSPRSNNATTLLFVLFHPLYWSRRIRRLFVLLLPLGIVCWLALVFLLMLRAVTAPAVTAIGKFWNGEQRNRRAYGLYDYGRETGLAPADDARPSDRSLQERDLQETV